MALQGCLENERSSDWCVLLQDFICEHYGEDSSGYGQEIRELMELRQVLQSVSVHQHGSLIT